MLVVEVVVAVLVVVVMPDLPLQAQLLTVIALLGKLKLGVFGLAASRRGRRAAAEVRPVAEGEAVTLEQLAEAEVDDCYKRVFCAAATGALRDSGVEELLELVDTRTTTSLQAPASHQANKIRQAALYGMSR